MTAHRNRNQNASDDGETKAAPRSLVNPPARRRPSPPGQIPPAVVAPEAQADWGKNEPQTPLSPKPGEKRSDRQKRQPIGDHKVGYCRPPVEHQFKGRPGPGRPRGSLSHDTIMRRNLAQTRKVKIDGKVKVMPMREYLVMTQIKLAAEGKLAALKLILAESARLYPDRPVVETDHGSSAELTATDQAIIDWFADEIRGGGQDDGEGA